MTTSGLAATTNTAQAVRILIVEDEVLIAETVKTKLTKLGYQITGMALSGEEALQVFEDAQPDIVLMDIKLGGGMDGIQTAEQLREMRPVPIIFVTAFSDDETIARVKRCSPYGYVIKPFQLNDLRTNIELALHRYQQEQAQRVRQQQLQQAMRYLQQAFLVMDAEGTVLFSNIPEDLVAPERTLHLPGSRLDQVLLNAPVADLVTLAKNQADSVRLPAGTLLQLGPRGSLGIQGELQGVRNASGVITGLILNFQEAEDPDAGIMPTELLQEAYQLHHKAQREWARSLHEGLGQVLSAAKMNLETVNLPEGEDQSLEQSKQLLDSAVGQVRKLTQAVMPNLLADFGLSPAVESYLRRLAQEDGRIKADIVPQTRRYPEVLEYHVYRLVQELVQCLQTKPELERMLVKLAPDADDLHLILTIRTEPKELLAVQEAALFDMPACHDAKARMRLIHAAIQFLPEPSGAHTIEVEIPLP